MKKGLSPESWAPIESYFENFGPTEKFLEISKVFPTIVVLKSPENGFSSYFVYLENTPS